MSTNISGIYQGFNKWIDNNSKLLQFNANNTPEQLSQNQEYQDLVKSTPSIFDLQQTKAEQFFNGLENLFGANKNKETIFDKLADITNDLFVLETEENYNNNIAQLGKYTALYAADWNDFFPYPPQGKNTGWYLLKRNEVGNPLKNYIQMRKYTYIIGGIIRRSADKKVYRDELTCPSVADTHMDYTSEAPGEVNVPQTLNSAYYSVAVNVNLVTDPCRMNRIKQPGQLIMYTDSVGSGSTDHRCRWHSELTNFNYVIPPRHSGGANFCYADLHIKFRMEGEFPGLKYGYQGDGPIWYPKPLNPAPGWIYIQN